MTAQDAALQECLLVYRPVFYLFTKPDFSFGFDSTARASNQALAAFRKGIDTVLL